MKLTLQAPNMTELQKKLMTEKDVRTASFRAINRSLTAGRKAAGEEVAADYNTPAGRVSKSGRITKANGGNLNGVVNFHAKGLPLEKWNVRPRTRRKGRNPAVWASVSKRFSTKYKGAFLAKYQSSETRVYVRKGKSRFPIVRLYGPSVSALVRADRVKERFMKRSSEMLQKRLEHEINYIASKK